MPHPPDILRALARGESVPGSKVSIAVVESAIEHRMAPLLFSSIVSLDETSLEATMALIAVDMAEVERRRRQDEILGIVHQLLDDAGVTHTFVKGAASANRWFEEPTHRPYADIDVVVPPGEPFRDAIHALDESHPSLSSLDTQAAQYISSVGTTIGGIPIDVQTDALRTGLTPTRYESWTIGTDELEFDRGMGLRVLDREHDLVMFLIHQGRDRFRYLLGVAEFGYRLKEPQNWARVEAISRAEGIWEQVAVAIEVMSDELRIAAPVKAPKAWRTSLWRKLWRPEVRLLGELGRIRYIRRADWVMPITMKGRFIEALRWLSQTVFPPDPVLRLNYPLATGPYLWRAVSCRIRVVSRRRAWVWNNSRR